MSVASAAFLDFIARPTRDLEYFLVNGGTPSIQAISGSYYRGHNFAWIAGPLGIRTFIKDFYTTESGETYGRSTVLKQNGINPFGELKPTGEHVRRRIRYRVMPVNLATPDNRYPNALLLDYRAGGTGRSDPASGLRDYLVRLEPGNDDLLLGKAFIALGPLRIATGFFLIERIGPLDPDTLDEIA